MNYVCVFFISCLVVCLLVSCKIDFKEGVDIVVLVSCEWINNEVVLRLEVEFDMLNFVLIILGYVN